jgi:hypothetical protein
MKRRTSITLTFTILSMLFVLGLPSLWPPVSATGGPLPALQGEDALNHPQPFIVALQGHANPAPTEDPCVLVNTEEATGSALGIGPITWASREVVNLCLNAEGAEVKGEFTITAANGDRLFGVYQTLAKLDFESNEITAHGRYRIVGGTGTFNGASGEGIIGAAGSLAPPFEFRGVLLGRVSF